MKSSIEISSTCPSSLMLSKSMTFMKPIPGTSTAPYPPITRPPDKGPPPNMPMVASCMFISIMPPHAVREVAPHARSAKSGAHIPVAHSLVGDHQPSGSSHTRQGEEMNLCARLEGSLQRSTRGVAADEPWRRFQKHLVLAVLRQTTPGRNLPGWRTLALEDVGAVKSSIR